MEKMADADIKIITLTITEGDYKFNTATGAIQIAEPSIQWDLNNPRNPKTVFGDLIYSRKFTETYVNAPHCLYQKKVIVCVKESLILAFLLALDQ